MAGGEHPGPTPPPHGRASLTPAPPHALVGSLWPGTYPPPPLPPCVTGLQGDTQEFAHPECQRFIVACRTRAPLLLVGGDFGELSSFLLGLQALMAGTINQPFYTHSRLLWARARVTVRDQAKAWGWSPKQLLSYAFRHTEQRTGGDEDGDVAAGLRAPAELETLHATSPPASCNGGHGASAALDAVDQVEEPTAPLSAYVGAAMDLSPAFRAEASFDPSAEIGESAATANSQEPGNGGGPPSPPPRRRPGKRIVRSPTADQSSAR